jgi:hypothetical protein
MSEGQLHHNENAERIMCECGAGPFLGKRGLTTHLRVNKTHGGVSPRLGTGKSVKRGLLRPRLHVQPASEMPGELRVQTT